MGTQEFLDAKVGHLFPKKDVPKEHNEILEKVNDQREAWRREYDKNPGKTDKDAILVYYGDERWNPFQEWFMHNS